MSEFERSARSRAVSRDFDRVTRRVSAIGGDLSTVTTDIASLQSAVNALENPPAPPAPPVPVTWTQFGFLAGTTDTNGDLSVTFPVAYGSWTTVLLTPLDTAAVTAILTASGSTGFTARFFNGTTAAASAYIQFYWVAVGPPVP